MVHFAVSFGGVSFLAARPFLIQARRGRRRLSTLNQRIQQDSETLDMAEAVCAPSLLTEAPERVQTNAVAREVSKAGGLKRDGNLNWVHRELLREWVKGGAHARRKRETNAEIQAAHQKAEEEKRRIAETDAQSSHRITEGIVQCHRIGRSDPLAARIDLAGTIAGTVLAMDPNFRRTVANSVRSRLGDDGVELASVMDLLSEVDDGTVSRGGTALATGGMGAVFGLAAGAVGLTLGALNRMKAKEIRETIENRLPGLIAGLS